MKVIVSNDEKCCGCFTCDKVLPGFKKTYKGLIILKSQYKSESIDFAASRAKDMCPKQAISINFM